jgi:hypothetical protein
MAQLNNFSFIDSDYDIDYCKKISGFTTVTPAIPFEGMAIKEVSRFSHKVSKEFQISPFHNFVSIGEMAIEGVFRVFFDREKEEEIIKAQQWSEQYIKS